MPARDELLNRVANWKFSLVLAAVLALAPGRSEAHPHVFVEANLEVLRDEAGAITQLRHVWRFDELFSSTVLIDFDDNGNGALDTNELDEVSSVVTETIGENGFFTKSRRDGSDVPFQGPERILVDYVDGQVLMFFALTFDNPIDMSTQALEISVSDPTFYVAMDLVDETAIQITGKGGECGVEIKRPDFEALYAANQTTLSEQFFAENDNFTLADDWLTWIEFNCQT